MAATEDMLVGEEVQWWRVGSKTTNSHSALLIKLHFPNYEMHVSNSHGFSTATKGDVQHYGRSNTQEALGCDRGSFQGRKKGESADGAALFCQAICGNSGLPNKATHGGNPLDKARNQGCDRRSSQGSKEGVQSEAMCGNNVGAIGEQSLDKTLNQGGDVRAVQGMSTSQKGVFSDLAALGSCGSKGPSHKPKNGGKEGLLNKVEVGAEIMEPSGQQHSV
ncbi:hypothetical protein F0562_010380 [Nyssa sinensis]|uniref:Uncharacterized protein n=1 Tax=Nyssa sinensis TaxID=561372 RepID=A0A5J5A1M7_9ASTE|nr:hypothetical protein F0562_010380 [Nyssa sinensis]